MDMNLSNSVDGNQEQHEEQNIGLGQLNTSGDVGPLLGKMNRSPSINSSGDNVGAEIGSLEKNLNFSDVKCDDCSRTEPIRQWRWCSACERVLCETCAVEGHYSHTIESYATGVRRSDNEHRQVMEEVRLMAEKLTEGAKKTDDLKTEIVAKLGAIKRDMSSKIDESKDVEDTLDNHLSSMVRLEREPLNAKTWVERNQSVVGVEALMKKACDNQQLLEEYMKSMDTLIDESGRKLGGIFREGE